MIAASSCIDNGTGLCVPQALWYFVWTTGVASVVIIGLYARFRQSLIARWSAQEDLEPWEFVKAHRPRRLRVLSLPLLTSEVLGVAAGILLTLPWAHSAEVILSGAIPGAAAGLIGGQCWGDMWLLRYKRSQEQDART